VLRPYPFYLGIAFSLLGYMISVILVKDTKLFTQLEIRNQIQQEKEEKAGDKQKDKVIW
jgi:hypothetical protein